ncbi:LOW QUALITY PROTEIN: maestro heat-like repeat-containing protein family member 9 [Desmodus rotundus]|uniref:LOW QUALITY PROTEIN: maestro heat-like repeat-containing protein family member 9 n=1 Tax=Desmodus rotundus TaxID=9430 RepID=UPI002380E79B|nr:LOW QUALITY PROTEIN: maestro heat-like repeat-containing protein family member 9 [Desmodus rotundus]
MATKNHKTSKNSRYSKDKVTDLQRLQSSVKWQHLEHKVDSLWDAYTSIINDQALILSINSSFVDPLLQFETQLKIIKSSFKMVFTIPSLEEVKEMGDDDDDEDLQELYQSILNIYEDTLLILVSKDLYKLQILKEMAVWMGIDRSCLQERVLVIISRVLIFAAKKVKESASVDAPCLGVLAAELCLLCSHPNRSITQQASLGMYHLLCIAKHQNEDIVRHTMAKYEQSGNQCLLSHCCDIEFLLDILKEDKTQVARSIGHMLLPSLLTDFVWSLLMRLAVPDRGMAKEAANMLKLTLEYHAHKVTMVSKIVELIYTQLCENSNHVMKQAMLRVITLLTRTSPKKVIFQLMDYPVPADNTLTLMWQAAGSEASVALPVLKTILLILRGKPGEMQESLADRRRFSLDATNMMPVAASQALCTLLPVHSYKKAVAQFFPQLLMALLFQLFYTCNITLVMENKLFFARDALRVLLNCSGLQEVDTALNRKNFWDQISQVLFHHHGVYLIATTLGEHNFPQFPETLHYLYKLSVEGPRRSEDSVITVIFLTELLNKFFKDPFPEEFLVLFRNWINDSNPAVSKLSLQKIASMAPVINQVRNVYSLLLCILDAFLSKDKTVIIRALLTLRRLLNKLDKVTYSSLCTQIASSYCPLMDHSNGGIRCMAIRHFGELVRDMSQYRWMLNNAVFRALVPLILFLEDRETRVTTACKHTLAICASELHWSTSHLLLGRYYSFELVVLSICNHLFISHGSYIVELLSDALGFLRNSRAYLRRASVILIGYLTALGGHLLLRDDIEVMLEGVDRVLEDEDPEIRVLASITYKLLKDVAHKLTSSVIKQTSRRLFNFIYIKKLKPLYNYNSPNDVTESPTEMKETRNGKRGLMHENDGKFRERTRHSPRHHSEEE